VEERAHEAVEAGNGGRARSAQLTRRRDQDVGLVLHSPGERQPPGPAVVVEGRGEHLGAEADVPEDVEVAGDVAQVPVDLRLRGEPA
jgi:hypothetical protein